MRRLLATELHLKHIDDTNCSVCNIPNSPSFNPEGLDHKPDCPWLAAERALADWDKKNGIQS